MAVHLLVYFRRHGGIKAEKSPFRVSRTRTERESNSPKARHHATEEEGAVALDEGGQEGEEAVDGHGNEQTLFTAHFVRKAAPEEGSEHHPQVHDAS